MAVNTAAEFFFRIVDVHSFKVFEANDSTITVVKDREYTKKEIKAEIEKMKNELEQMNTSSSVMLIDLNRLMNRRNEAVQLTSNIIRKDNETAMSVIKNI